VQVGQEILILKEIIKEGCRIVVMETIQPIKPHGGELYT